MNNMDKEGWNLTLLLEMHIKQVEKRLLENDIKNQTTKTTRSCADSNRFSEESKNFRTFLKYNKMLKKFSNLNGLESGSSFNKNSSESKFLKDDSCFQEKDF